MSEVQSIDTPHERRAFKDHGHVDVVTLGAFTLGRGVFEPGWRWSEDVKPIAGTDSCQTLGHKSAMETWDTYGHLMVDEDDRSRSVIQGALAALGKSADSTRTVEPR